jgi:hypothetical protein
MFREGAQTRVLGITCFPTPRLARPFPYNLRRIVLILSAYATQMGRSLVRAIPIQVDIGFGDAGPTAAAAPA